MTSPCPASAGPAPSTTEIEVVISDGVADVDEALRGRPRRLRRGRLPAPRPSGRRHAPVLPEPGDRVRASRASTVSRWAPRWSWPTGPSACRRTGRSRRRTTCCAASAPGRSASAGRSRCPAPWRRHTRRVFVRLIVGADRGWRWTSSPAPRSSIAVTPETERFYGAIAGWRAPRRAATALRGAGGAAAQPRCGAHGRALRASGESSGQRAMDRLIRERTRSWIADQARRAAPLPDRLARELVARSRRAGAAGRADPARSQPRPSALRRILGDAGRPGSPPRARHRPRRACATSQEPGPLLPIPAS